jgi:hypothetical protein
MPAAATFRTRNAPLTEQFGIDYATRLFGAETIASLPRYQRGPKAGKINAFLSWDKCETGGWSRTHGCAYRPNELVRARLTSDAFGTRPLTGQFLGRTTTHDLSGALLGEQNRARTIAQQERDHREMMALAAAR